MPATPAGVVRRLAFLEGDKCCRDLLVALEIG